MPAPRKYPRELRERAVRLVNDATAEDPEFSLNETVLRIGPRVGVVTDKLRGCAKHVRVDQGFSPVTTTADAARIKDLERKVKELKRASAILVAVSSFFARDLEPRLPW